MPVDLGWAQLALLPAAPYSVDTAASHWTLGLALERQTGVHAVAGQARHDFDAWPGEVALTAPGVPVFSESALGGEYLWLQLRDPPWAATPASPPRQVVMANRATTAQGWALRRALLAHASGPTPGGCRTWRVDSGNRPQRGQCLPDLQPTISKPDSLLEAAACGFLNACWRLPRAAAPSGAASVSRSLGPGLLEFIDAHLDQPLSLDTLAAQVDLPPLGFLRRFTQAVGTTPHAYVNERRVQRARQLLIRSHDPVAEIAAACGFAHQSHLGQVFKRATGLTPQHYRHQASRAA